MDNKEILKDYFNVELANLELKIKELTDELRYLNEHKLKMTNALKTLDLI